MEEKTEAALGQLVNLFESGNAPKAISIAMFPKSDVPSSHWSLCNRILMALGGTEDARGYLQWQEIGRQVRSREKGGACRIRILGPRKAKRSVKTVDETGNEKTEDRFVTVGFYNIPVYAVEQTDGKPVEYQKLEIPPFPFLERAKEWGIEVKAVGHNGQSWMGYFVGGQEKEIVLATPHERVFFHELAHAAHERVLGLKGRKNSIQEQEIVAELTAATLCQLVGLTKGETTGNSFSYIHGYAQSMGITVGRACHRVLSDVGKCIDMIMGVKTPKEEK